MIIKNYGLFWKRDRVFWGRQGVSGHLLGTWARNQTAGQADFRDQQGVYCLYDQGFQLVYVGQAGANDQQRLFGRLKQHTRDALADRWSQFSWFGIRRVKQDYNLAAEADGAHTTSGQVLNHIEAVLIAAAEPPHNRQGGRFGEEVEQYLQYRDHESLGPEMLEMITELWRGSQK